MVILSLLTDFIHGTDYRSCPDFNSGPPLMAFPGHAVVHFAALGKASEASVS